MFFLSSFLLMWDLDWKNVAKEQAEKAREPFRYSRVNSHYETSL